MTTKRIQVPVRIDEKAKERLQSEADKQGRSLSNYIRLILEKSTKK